jgi:pimeloyl-ACP methyl ester carboxylesterase
VRADGFRGYRGGSGEPLVLIHGGGGHWRQWRPVIPLLEPRHEVLAVNLVGHWGGRPRPRGAEASIDLLVDGVERDMADAGWDTAHVAGTSLGGWVALELAKRGRARTCTAMCGRAGWPPGGDLGVRLVARSYGLFHAGAQLLARDPARWSRRRRLRRLVFWHHFARPDRMDPRETAHMLVGMARCTILPAFFAWAKDHPPEGFGRARCPVQLLFAERDVLFPRRRYGEALVAEIRGAEVHDIPGAGHVATWDEPERVAELILDFTARHSASRDPAGAAPDRRGAI